MHLLHGGIGVLARRGLVEVQPKAKLTCVARARACREGGGMVRRGGEKGCSGGLSAEVMDNQKETVNAWGGEQQQP